MQKQLPLLKTMVNQSQGRWNWYVPQRRAVRRCSDIAFEELLVTHSVRSDTLEALVLTLPLYELRKNGVYLVAHRIYEREMERALLLSMRAELADEILAAERGWQRDLSHEGLLQRIVRQPDTAPAENLVFGALLSLLDDNLSGARTYLTLSLKARERLPLGDEPASTMWLKALLNLLDCNDKSAVDALRVQIKLIEQEMFEEVVYEKTKALSDSARSLALDWISLQAADPDSQESGELFRALKDEIGD